MAKTNVERQAAWRAREMEARRAHRDIMERWQEQNRFVVTKQEDGGYKISLKTTVQGRRLTVDLAARCDLAPDAFLQQMVAEILMDEYGGRFLPARKD